MSTPKPCQNHTNLRRVRNVRAAIQGGHLRSGVVIVTRKIKDVPSWEMKPLRVPSVGFREMTYCADCEYVLEAR